MDSVAAKDLSDVEDEMSWWQEMGAERKMVC